MIEGDVLTRLVALSREIGREDRRMAILGEGNTSADNGDGTFWVKASGSRLGAIEASGFSRVDAAGVLELLGRTDLDDDAIAAGLEENLADSGHRRPSVEAFLHAVCLAEEGVTWVGHTHTESVLAILCSRHGAEPFRRHIYPDAIVVCGRHIAAVPYIDPGLALARAVRDELDRFRTEHGGPPKLLLMENHGPVALGDSAREVLNIMSMADKWARILGGALAVGGIEFMPESDADRIDGRLDEEYRRRRL